MSIYTRIRPFITRGDIIKEEQICNNAPAVQAIIEREQAKYSKTFIMEKFQSSLNILMHLALQEVTVQTVTDIGCGYGMNLSQLARNHPELSFTGIDLVEELIKIATQKYYNVPNLLFINKNFLYYECSSSPDLGICLETLEHIEDGTLQDFVEKLFEVSRKALILSVPREPVWCLANIMRFKYWLHLGNTPSHLQHWTKKNFESFILDVAKQKWGGSPSMISHSPLNLWTMLLLINHNSSG